MINRTLIVMIKEQMHTMLFCCGSTQAKPVRWCRLRTYPESGAVLLALVVLMVMVGFLGAAMTHQTATGSLSSVSGNRSQQVFYLAESGYRYAAAKMKKSSDLNTLHDHGPYAIGNAGTFTVQFYPYIFDAVNTDGAGTLTAKVPFGDVPSMAMSVGAGDFFYLKTASQTEPFQTILVSDDTISFVKDTGLWNVLPSERVRLAVKSNGDLLTEGGDLNLQSTSSASAFPLRHGRILMDGKVYQYKIREQSKLAGVTRADDQPWEAPALYNGMDVILLDFMELHSTGRIGNGAASVSRKVVYNIPVYGTDNEEFHDPFDDKSHWEETSTKGSHVIETIAGDKVLKVESTTVTGPVSKSQIALVPSTTSIDFSKTHGIAGDFLSYDTQVKVGFSPDIPDHYMAGITFRLNGTTGEHFGVSFQKPDFYDLSGAIDQIPDDLVPSPMQNQYGIVLWQELAAGWDWLAYKKLTPVILFQDDMEGDSSAWSQTDTWGKTTWAHGSGHSFTDSVSGNYSNNQETSIISRTLDLSNRKDVSLSFYHYYSIEPPYSIFGGYTDFGAVEISNDNGATWTELGRFANWYLFFIEMSQNSWKKETFSIPDVFLSDQMKIRFRLVTDYSVTRDGWYIDDVRLDSNWFPETDATLVVHLVEAAAITFTNGILPKIEDRDILISQVNGTRGVVVGEPIVNSGSWASGNAAGIIRLNNLSAPAGFPNGPIQVIEKGTNLANVTGFRARDNYIQVYYGDGIGYGIPNSTPLDNEKLASSRITSSTQTLKWPSKDANDTTPLNDYYTTVQWDGYNSLAVSLLGTGLEKDTIIRAGQLTTGPGYSPDPEIALHTFGMDVYSTSVYFDDFGLRTNQPALQGFLPAIQE